jgi:DNA-binding transcriptional LysR family regulator
LDRRDGVEGLCLRDLSTFLNVHRTGSVSATARELGVTPSQVSRAILRLETALTSRLFTRGARGIALSPAGCQRLPQLEKIVSLARSLGRGDMTVDGELTIAAPSSLLPPLLPAVIKALPRVRVRGVELPLAVLRGYANEELFDVALLPGGTVGLPPKWVGVRIGVLRKSLLASPATAKRLGRRPTARRVREMSFVGPIAYDGGKCVASGDDCPLGVERTFAVEVDTMSLALRVASECDYLVFGPVIAARRELAEGALVELEVEGWSVSEPLFLACHAERVVAREQRAILRAVRSTLEPRTP